MGFNWCTVENKEWEDFSILSDVIQKEKGYTDSGAETNESQGYKI